MTDQTKVISRVRKLLALSGDGGNANESAAAMAAAQRLMTEHAIEQAMLDEPENMDEPDEEIVNFTAWDDALEQNRKQVTWKTRVAVSLANHNACRVYLRGGGIHLVGRPSDVATVRYLYKFCVREVARLTKLQGRGHGRTWYNNYRLGVTDAISYKLAQMRRDLFAEKRTEAKVSGGSTALVLVNTAIEKVEQRKKSVVDWVDTNMKLGAGRNSNHRHDGGARDQGKRDGRSINLSGGKGLGSGTRKQLKGGS